jgi:hypothetical protein
VLPRTGAFRFAIALLTLFAFTAQTVVTQTHIHAGAVTGAARATIPHAPLPDKAPSGDDQANCPICQGLLHAGAYVTPSTVAVLTLSVTTFVNIVALEVIALEQANSHAWKSRAPPSA